MCERKKTGYTLVASQNRSIWRLLKAPKSTRLVTRARSSKRQRLARNDKLVYISLDKGAPGKKNCRCNLWPKWYLLKQKIRKRKGRFNLKIEKSIWRSENYRNCHSVISTLGHHDCALSKWKNAEIKRKQKENEENETKSTRYLLLSHTYSQVRLVKFIRNIPT